MRMKIYFNIPNLFQLLTTQFKCLIIYYRHSRLLEAPRCSLRDGTRVSGRSSPVVVMDPHEDGVHPLAAQHCRVRQELHHGAQELPELRRSQPCHHLGNYVQTHFLSLVISIKRGIFKNTDLTVITMPLDMTGNIFFSVLFCISNFIIITNTTFT